MEAAEKLNPEESKYAEMRAQIDHLLIDYGEYPEIFLTNEEKIDVAEKHLTDAEFNERREKGLHNKYSTNWLTAVLGSAEQFFIPLLPKEKQKEYTKRYWELFDAVNNEKFDKISKETINKANKLLEDLRQEI